MGILRKKKPEKVSSPEQIDEYIQVTTPAVWIALIALAVLLAVFLVWSIFGTVGVHDEEGNAQAIHPIKYVIN